MEQLKKVEEAKKRLKSWLIQKKSGSVLTSMTNRGILTFLQVVNLKKDIKYLDTLPLPLIILIYQEFTSVTPGVPSADETFPREALTQASLYISEKKSAAFPLKLKVVQKMSQKDEYLIVLDAQTIYEYLRAGLIQVRSDAQRESVFTFYGGKLVTHVAYNDNAAREIGDCISKGVYWSNMLRWHLVVDDQCNYDYLPDDNLLVVRDGLLLNIDGQHRMIGLEYALEQNPNLDIAFPIALTIGDIRTAQKIIAQEEKRQPINKTHVMAFSNTVGGNIVQKLSANSELQEIYQFVDSTSAVKNDLGFMTKGVLADAINKNFSNCESIRDQRKLVSYLTDFLLVISDYCDDLKSINKTIFKYMSLAKEFYGINDWEAKLSEKLEQGEVGE